MAYPIEHDYHAYRKSGLRSLSAIKYIVIHDMENDNALTAAEGTGRWFESSAAQGSTNYGLDNNSIQQYLDDKVIPWGAASNGGGINKSGLHIEVVGKASHSRDLWLKEHGAALDRLAWLIWYKATKYGIPLQTLSDAELKAGVKKGIITHAQVTRVFKVAGGHTDPGAGFPLDLVMQRARKFAPSPVNPHPDTAPPSTPAVKTCIGSGVRIRTKPSIVTGKVIGYLQKGQKVIVTGHQQGGFSGIRSPKLGWVATKYLR